MTDFAGVTIFACQQDMSGEGGRWIYIPTPPTMIDVRFIIKVYSKGTSPMPGGVSISGQIIFSDECSSGPNGQEGHDQLQGVKQKYYFARSARYRCFVFAVDFACLPQGDATHD